MSRRRKKSKPKPTRTSVDNRRRLQVPFADAFPPDDPVGHFVISLSVAHNDLALTNQLLYPPASPHKSGLNPGDNAALLRRAISQLWEVHLLVKEGDQDPDVSTFIERLADAYPWTDPDGPALVAALRGQTGGTAPRLRQTLADIRNLSNHYEKPGSQAFKLALESLAGEAAIVSGREHGMETVRAEFAEEVMVRLAFNQTEAELAEFFSAISESVVAVIHLAQTAITVWFSEHGAEEMT